MSKHTPGPWRVENANSEALHDIALDYEVKGEGSPVLIGFVYWDDEDDFIPLAAADANARLMAAAPELLAELRDFHDHTIDQGWHDCDGIPGGCPVLAAIAKAVSA